MRGWNSVCAQYFVVDQYPITLWIGFLPFYAAFFLFPQPLLQKQPQSFQLHRAVMRFRNLRVCILPDLSEVH